jgi:hypothetical protein
MAAATLTFPSQTLLKNVVDPVDGTDAATKTYVDNKTGAGSVAAAGSNTQIQFNNAGSIGASANLTFDYAGNILTITGNIGANYYNGNGYYLTGIQSAGGTANTVSASSQPNITSTGNLVNLQIGNLTSSLTGGNGIVYFDGNGDANLSGNINATGNITVGSGTGGSIAGANSVTANYFIGDGSQLTGVAVYFTTGSANFANYAGNVTEAAQPNITTVGTLQYLTVSGDANIQGNLTVGGTLTYIDSTKVSIVDPVLELGGGPDGSPLSTNDTLDRGTLLHRYEGIQGSGGKAVDSFMGWKNSDSQFVFGSNVTDIASSVTVNEYANIKAANFLGNLIGTRANVSNVNFTNNVIGGNLVSANYFTGTLTTASQPNITSTGTLTSLTVSGKTTLSTVSNVIITGGTTGQYLQTDGTGNLSWVTISSATISTGTSNVKVNSDGNVTISSGGNANVLLVSGTGVVVSGNLTGINNGSMNSLSILDTTVSTNSTTGALKVAGGVGIVGNINTAGNLTVNGTSSLSNVTINGNLVAGNANFSLPVNITSPTDSTDPTTGALILTLGGLGVHGNINAGLDISGTTLTGPLTTGSQPNITSLGTLTGLDVSGIGNIANANVGNLVVNKLSNLGPAGNITITGGTAGQYLSTDGSGNLSWESAASTNRIVNSTSNVTVNNDGNVTISGSGKSNVIVVNGNAVSINGTLQIANLTTTNAVSITSTTNSTQYTNGALTIAGGLGVAGNIVTNNSLTIAGDIHTSNLIINGNSTTQGNAEFQRLVTLTNPTDSINPSTGALQITLGGLGVYGNINSGMNISGSTLTGSLTTASQPNITSVGSLSSLTVTGNITTGNVVGANLISANYLTGTLTTGNQSNITTVGTLGNLNVTSNVSTSNLIVTGNTNLGAVGNITITGGSSGQYLQTDGTGNISWRSVSTSALVSGTSNIAINPSGNVNVSAAGVANVVQIGSTQVLVTPTTDSTSTTTGAMLVNGGVGIAGNLYIGGILNVSGDFQVGNLLTNGPVAHTGEVSFTQTTYFTNAASSTNTTSGAVQITGGLGIQGNIYGGNVISSANTILRNGRNVPTFVSSATMPSTPLLGDEWYDQNNDRIYQYIYDGSNYNWIDVSGGYISANVQAQGGTLVVRDNNGNVYANTIHANELDVTNLVITGTTSISSMASAGAGKPVSNSIDTLIDTFPKTLYRSAKYIISARNDDGFEVAEVLTIHDDSISFIQTYGDVSTGTVADIVTFSSNIVAGNVCLYATGSNSNTFVNFVATYVTD